MAVCAFCGKRDCRNECIKMPSYCCSYRDGFYHGIAVGIVVGAAVVSIVFAISTIL